jgi:hypothetical protein
MNTKSLLTRIGVPVLSLGLLGGLGATLATSASASTMATTLSASVKPPAATVVASTHEFDVPDTTSGTATTVSSSGGPVWAYDDVTKTFRVTPDGGNQYTVTETVNGTFSAFDEPNTGDPINSTPINVTGQMHGTNTYTVTSDVAPDASKLAAQYDDQKGNAAISTGDLIKHIFGDDPSVQVGGGNNWVFAYHAAGGSMTQRYDTAPNTWGNITG